MHNRFYKYNIFLTVIVGLSITFFMLEIEKDNNLLLGEEYEKSTIYKNNNNNNLQSTSTAIDYENNLNKKISNDDRIEITTISNNKNNYDSELTIHIPKGAFHPATNRSFNPDEILINKGETITWINEEEIPHTITSKGKILFDSLLKQNEDFTYQFNKVGTFEFECTLHPWMHGTINVI